MQNCMGAGAAPVPMQPARQDNSQVIHGPGPRPRHLLEPRRRAACRFWNTTSGALVNAVDSGGQVCALAWSANANELVSCHGALPSPSPRRLPTRFRVLAAGRVACPGCLSVL